MPWNHNIAFHPLILDQVPAGCADALDIGCGDGLLTRKLATMSGQVTGLDLAPEMVALSRKLAPTLRYVEGDLLTCDLPDKGFDFVSTVAVVHHMDFTAALRRMSDLLRLGGRLVVVGIAANRTPLDWVYDAASVVAHQVLHRVHGFEQSSAPVAEPSMSWSQVRREALRLLPGARYRRHTLWRYSLVWTKP
jgi:SAM-dependent methyltransferase